MLSSTTGELTWAGRLQALRRRHSLSQEELARRLGVSFTTVNRWEQERSVPSASTVARLTGILDELELAPGPGAGVSDASSPAAAATPTSTVPIVMVPVDRSSFVGRDRELAELAAAWTDRRLLTLTGAGGVGKSRLAIELLRRTGEPVLGMAHFDELSDPSLVVGSLAVALGAHGSPSGPDAETLARSVAAAQGVLVLDTCEHVTESLRDPLARILAAAPGVRVLATSQASLGTTEEHVWHVHPMRADEVASDAVALFLTRARELRPDFAGPGTPLVDVVEICRRLEGMPLALELAAAWMSSMSPAQLLSRWDERGELLAHAAPDVERHRTPGAGVAWSAALLTEEQRQLVAELSVFSGAFVLEDVEAVATAPSRAALLAQLRRLVELSWVEFEATGLPHYRMLDPLREWGRARLQEQGRADDARLRLAAHVGQVCRQAESEHFQAGPGQWRQRLDLGAATVSATLDWASGRDPELAAGIATDLLGWWRSSGRLLEGRHWFDAASADTVPVWLRARAACGEALLALDMGDYDTADERAATALAALGEDDDDLWAARALTARSSVAKYRGEPAEARELLEAAVVRLERLGDQRQLAIALNNLGALTAEHGELDAAEGFYGESLRLKRALGDRRSVALTMANLADVRVRTGSAAEAVAMLDEAVALLESDDDQFLVSFLGINRGEALLELGDATAALEEFGRARVAADRADVPRFQALAACGAGQALHALGRASDALRSLRESKEIAERIGDEIVLNQVRRAMSDAVGFAPEVRRPKNLSIREVQVLQHLIGGLPNEELATRLNISPATVQRHLSNIYRKLGVRNRTEAADVARELGLRRSR